MTDTRKTAVLWTLLVVTVATFVFSPFLVGQRSWGFDYFRYLTPPIRWALSAGLILTVLAPLLRQLAAGFSTAANVTNRQLYGARGEVWRLGFCAVACALFYTFWVDTFFLGDGYQTIANYASASGVYFHNVKITSLGSSYLARGAQSLFGLYSETTARLTFRILSTLSGGIVVWNLLGIARIMSADPVRRLLFSITAIITPTILLYFGYVEFYPLTWAAATTYFHLALRYLMRESHLLTVIIAYVALCLTHFTGLTFALGLLVLALQIKSVHLFVKRNKVLVIGIITVATLIKVYFAYKFVTSHIAWRNIFLPITGGIALDPDYSIFSLRHFSDLLNLYLLIIPAGLLWLALACFGRTTLKSDKVSQFLLVSSLGSILFLLLIDPGLGMARDWDLFSIMLLPISLTLFRLGFSAPDFSWPRWATSLALIPAVCAIGFVVVNSRATSARDRFVTLLDIDSGKGRAGWYTLAEYYRDSGDKLSAQKADSVLSARFPERNIAVRVFQLLEAGRIEEARRGVAYLLDKDPYSVEALYAAGQFQTKTGNYPAAWRYLEDAKAIAPGAANYYICAAELLTVWRGPQSAITLAEEGIQLYPENPSLLSLLANNYVNVGRWRDAELIADKIIAIDHTNATGYLALTFVRMNKGDTTAAAEAFKNYLLYGAARPENAEMRQRFHALIPPDSTQ